MKHRHVSTTIPPLSSHLRTVTKQVIETSWCSAIFRTPLALLRVTTMSASSFYLISDLIFVYKYSQKHELGQTMFLIYRNVYDLTTLKYCCGRASGNYSYGNIIWNQLISSNDWESRWKLWKCNVTEVRSTLKVVRDVRWGKYPHMNKMARRKTKISNLKSKSSGTIKWVHLVSPRPPENNWYPINNYAEHENSVHLLWIFPERSSFAKII